MPVLNSKCVLHYEFNLSFLILSPPLPLPLGEAEALDCCCGKLGPNKYDALLLLVFSKIQLQHFRRTHLGINSTRNVGRSIIFSTFWYLTEWLAYKEAWQLVCVSDWCACHFRLRFGRFTTARLKNNIHFAVSYYFAILTSIKIKEKRKKRKRKHKMRLWQKYLYLNVIGFFWCWEKFNLSSCHLYQ